MQQVAETTPQDTPHLLSSYLPKFSEGSAPPKNKRCPSSRQLGSRGGGGVNSRPTRILIGAP